MLLSLPFSARIVQTSLLLRRGDSPDLIAHNSGSRHGRLWGVDEQRVEEVEGQVLLNNFPLQKLLGSTSYSASS